MSRRSIAIWGVVALGMLLLAILDPWQPASERPARRIVSTEELALVDQITFRDEGQVQQIQLSEGQPWRSVLPAPGVADEQSVAQLFAVLRLLQSVRQRDADAAHGCTPQAPQLTLRFRSGHSREIAICAASADGRHRWLRLDGRGTVLLVESHLVSELLQRASELRSQRLVPWVLSTAVPLRVSLAKRWVQVGQHKVRWGQGDDAPREMALAMAPYREWVEALGSLSEDAGPECVHPEPLLIEQAEQGVRLSPQSCVAPRAWSRVALGFEHPQRLADMHVLPTRRPEGNFRIECNGATREVDVQTVDQPVLWRWWRELDMSAIDSAPAESFESTCSIVGSNWDVSIGQDGGRWLARVPQAPSMFILDPHVATLFLNISELFRSTLLIEEEAIFVRRLEITDGSKVLVLVRPSAAAPWVALAGAGSNTEAAAMAEPMARALGMLAAEHFAVASEPTPAGGVSRRIRVEFEAALSGPSIEHQIVLGGDAATCWAQVDAKPRAVLSPGDCAALWAGRQAASR